MNNRYIGAGQAAVIMAVTGVLGLITADFTDMGAMLSNAVSAVILTALALIPLAVLIKDGSGSVPRLAVVRMGFVGRILSLLYGVYFISAAADFIADYSVFASERYYAAGAQVCAVLLGVICAYISHTGAETVCRMSTLLLFMLVLTGAAYAVNGFGDIISYDYTKMIPKEISLYAGNNGLFPVIAAGAAAMCVLCAGMGKRTRKGVFGGAAAVLAALALAITGIWTVLDDYALVSEYPAADAVIYAFRKMSFRPDGVFFVLWTVMAAAVSSLMCACAAHCAEAAVPCFKRWGIAAAAIALICAELELWGINTSGIYNSPVCAFILIGAIPLILIILKDRRKAA